MILNDESQTISNAAPKSGHAAHDATKYFEYEKGAIKGISPPIDATSNAMWAGIEAAAIPAKAMGETLALNIPQRANRQTINHAKTIKNGE